MTHAVPAPDAFNPLAEDILARTIRRELEDQPMELMPPERFFGAGLYALYYVGPHPLYAGINDPALNVPVYVGRARAGASRMGRWIQPQQTDKLWRRILQHAASIDAATNLHLSDFRVRYLVMSDVMIVLGEAGLLHEYAPVWNVWMDGLGSNVHGEGRPNQRLSKWETVHPGRGRSSRPNALSADQVQERAREIIEATLRDVDR